MFMILYTCISMKIDMGICMGMGTDMDTDNDIDMDPDTGYGHTCLATADKVTLSVDYEDA